MSMELLSQSIVFVRLSAYRSEMPDDICRLRLMIVTHVILVSRVATLARPMNLHDFDFFGIRVVGMAEASFVRNRIDLLWIQERMEA